jgi:hypothetical protein
MNKKTQIKLTKAQKTALLSAFVPYCRHSRLNYDGDVKICGLKELRERCEYSTWDTWADCPSDCPHHILRTKVMCTPEKCAIADRFVKEIKECLTKKRNDSICKT